MVTNTPGGDEKSVPDVTVAAVDAEQLEWSVLLETPLVLVCRLVPRPHSVDDARDVVVREGDVERDRQ